MNKKLLLYMIISAMALGTAWAVRGKFGHEQGAAWAGAIGGIIIILLSGRKDWYQKIYTGALAAAIGWGMGGMISYGRVVGYGRADDFPNALYGLGMLFVIGALYGFTGGGLFGLALAHTKEKKVDWARLIVEMTIGGFITYGFLIAQLGWAMTPPRSELWAGCFGAGIAMVWYLYRNGWTAPLKVALYAMIGAGFGFASGNFLQVVIYSYDINFSGWNVMEYSIGFWGGLGMAYGVFTSKWKEPEPVSNLISPVSSKTALLFVSLFIPFVVWYESFSVDKLQNVLQNVDGIEVATGITVFRALALILVLGMTGLFVYRFYKGRGNDIAKKDVMIYFVALFAVYILYSDLRTASFFSWGHLEQKLYWVNFVIVLWVAIKSTGINLQGKSRKINFKHFSMIWALALVLIVLLTIIAIRVHGPIPGSQQRFPMEELTQAN